MEDNMNAKKDLVNTLKDMFVGNEKKVILANQEAMDKMETLKNDILNNKISNIETSIIALADGLKKIIEIEKSNQELILYLSTVNEELLNTIYGPEDNNNMSSQVLSEEEDNFLNEQWVSSKKNNLLN